jgi:YNFM family putative membrane transporter
MLADVFHASKTATSLTVTAATGAVAIAAPFIGIVADRLGRKRVIVAAACLMALSTLACATAADLTALIFWRFVQGLFVPGITAVTVAYIQEEWATGVGNATSAYVAGTVLGGFSGRFISGHISDAFGWRSAFIVLGVISLFAALVLALTLPRERRFIAQSSPLAAAWDHLRNPKLIATFAAGFCVLFSLLGTFTWITFYLAAPPFHLDTAALGSLFFVYLVGAVVTPIAGRSIDRFGHRIAMVGSMVLAASGLALTLVQSLPAVIAGLAMCCTGVFIAQSTSSTYIGRAATHSKALAVGMYTTFYYGGGSTGGAIPGLVWAAGGWPACVLLFIGVQTITVIIAALFWQPETPTEIAVQ